MTWRQWIFYSSQSVDLSSAFTGSFNFAKIRQCILLPPLRRIQFVFPIRSYLFVRRIVEYVEQYLTFDTTDAQQTSHDDSALTSIHSIRLNK